MRKITYLTIAIALLCSLSACTKTPQEEPRDVKVDYFLSTSDKLGLYANAAGTYIFDEDIHQTSISMSPTDYRFRIQTDDQKSIFAVEIAQFPTAIGTVVDVKVISNIETIAAKTYTMTTIKENSDMVWLWETEGSIGMVLEIP